jgi:hypothetical protein
MENALAPAEMTMTAAMRKTINFFILYGLDTQTEAERKTHPPFLKFSISTFRFLKVAKRRHLFAKKAAHKKEYDNLSMFKHLISARHTVSVFL